MNKPRLRTGLKLLVASVGVATVNYVVACKDGGPPTTGNLPAPPPPTATATASEVPTTDAPPIVGNLPAPPPPEPPVASASAAASAPPVAPVTKPK